MCNQLYESLEGDLSSPSDSLRAGYAGYIRKVK
nr:MAG TPA: hypothetical protein [Bacteriophage sp.]